MTNKSLESGSYNTGNYTETFMCVYTHTQASMSAFRLWYVEERKKSTKQTDKPSILKRLIGKGPQKFWQTIWLLLLQAKQLNECVSIVQFLPGSIIAVTEIWNLLLELFLKSGPRLCMTHVLISEQTGRSNILYGKNFSAKLIINNLGRETVLRLRQILLFAKPILMTFLK